MPWANSPDITNNEFYKEACRYADSKSTQTAAKWWLAFCEVITRRLYFDGRCRVPNLGIFGLRHVDESEQVQVSKQTGKRDVYVVPERDVPIFSPHDDFINDVNMAGVTKAFRRRQKSNKLTQRDWIRVKRAEAVGATGIPDEARIEEAKKKFQEMLKEKAKHTKGKVDLEDEESE